MHSLLKGQIDKKLTGGLNDLDIFFDVVKWIVKKLRPNRDVTTRYEN
jgi:hypothetical protein